MSRRLLARYTALTSRGAVYEAEDGLEIQTADHYEIHRQRVLWEDMLLVTLHRRIGAAFVLVNLGVVLFFVLVGLFFYWIAVNAAATAGPKNAVGWAMFFIFSAFGLPSFVALVIRLLWRVDEVTVWGRRSHAAMRFTFRKAKARRLFEEITERVRAAQDRLRAQYDAEAAAAPAPTPVGVGGETPPMPPPA